METKLVHGLTVGTALLLCFLVIGLGASMLVAVGIIHYVSRPEVVNQKSCCSICGKCPCQCGVLKPRIRPKGAFEDSINGDTDLPPVNENARSEVKTQCATCNQQPQYLPTLPANVSYPPAAVSDMPTTEANMLAGHYGAIIRVRDGRYTATLIDASHVWVSTKSIHTRTWTGNRAAAHAKLAYEMRMGVVDRSNNQPVAPVSEQPPKPEELDPNDTPAIDPVRQQMIFFHAPGDKTSERIKKLLEGDPKLVAMRSELNYQMYTADNKVYQTLKTQSGRSLKEEVPPSLFPAIVCADPDGGHVYFADPKSLATIKSSADLLGDIAHARHYKNEMKTQLGGRITSAEGDCDDCNKPNAGDEDAGSGGDWRLGQRFRDLFAGDREVEGFAKDAIWGWLDIIAGAAIAIVAIGSTAVGLGVFGLAAIVVALYLGSK